jgi:hypothetical protein
VARKHTDKIFREKENAMTSTFGTNSAGTKEWLAATKDMHFSAAEPVFSRTQTTIVESSDFTKQDVELKKAPTQTASSGAKTK